MRLTQIPFPWNVKIPTTGNPPIDINSANLSLGDVVSVLILYILPLAGLLLLIYLVFAGFQYLTSAGDPKKVEQAKERLTSALVGFVIVFAAYWIVQIVGTILGLGSTGFGGVFKLP